MLFKGKAKFYVLYNKGSLYHPLGALSLLYSVNFHVLSQVENTLISRGHYMLSVVLVVFRRQTVIPGFSSVMGAVIASAFHLHLCSLTSTSA